MTEIDFPGPLLIQLGTKVSAHDFYFCIFIPVLVCKKEKLRIYV